MINTNLSIITILSIILSMIMIMIITHTRIWLGQMRIIMDRMRLVSMRAHARCSLKKNVATL